jgi:hypothetical protein
MAQQTKSGGQLKSKRKKKKECYTDSVPILRNQARPTWKKNPDQIISMKKDMIGKKAKYLFDLVIILEFIQRLQEIHVDKFWMVKPAILWQLH